MSCWVMGLGGAGRVNKHSVPSLKERSRPQIGGAPSCLG